MNRYELKVGNGTLTAEVNKFAKQADGAVKLNYEETTILATSVASKRENKLDFFPLIINYDEKLYALGKIPGNYGRREAKPSDAATLAARLIDRPIRPLFPDGYNNEVQIVCSLLSLDHDYEADVLAINAASISLILAENIPFEGPVGAVSVGMIGDEFIINPNLEQRTQSKLEMKIAGTLTEINMVEVKAEELSESQMIEAFMFAHDEIKKIVKWQLEITKDLNIEKNLFEFPIEPTFVDTKKQIKDSYLTDIKECLNTKEKSKLNAKITELKVAILSNLNPSEDENVKNDIINAFEELEKEEFRRMIIEDKIRVDGRKIDEIRLLTSEIDILPRVHGSSLFTRGETQALVVATLGVKADEQRFDGLEIEESKNFMLHYNFPPFSVGECGRMGAPGRREIGHGHLAEKAISTMLPTEEEFPYTIRVVSEILESNGSSSQASICGASLALMAAGVPIKKPVAGIAMGMIADSRGYTILTDIQGLEDHLGDMDFKVAGTKDGICAIQMDMKIDGISKEMLTEALEQARVGRMEILDHMNSIISEPREELSEYAPKVLKMNIEVNQIKDVIGRGGDTINKIIDETNVKIDIEEDGTVRIYGTDQKMIDMARDIILKITKVYKVGDRYMAKVSRVETYGAFVRFEDQEGLLHISDLSDKRVEKVEDVVNLNDIIEVEIKEIDIKKRIKVKLVIKEVE
jgi:polyribonucleotide nucleotidyltransferase